MLENRLMALKSATSLDGIRVALIEGLAREQVEIMNYGAGRISTTTGPQVERYWTTMDPDWLTRYMALGYQKHDRLVRTAMTRIEPFFFEEVFATPPELPEQLEMETMFPYRRGFVIPMHSPFGRFGILSAVSEIDAGEWPTRRFESMARVAILAQTAHQIAEAIDVRETISLSSRETEVLTWAALGKTSDDIALLLGLTERTVRKHIDSAMKKLGAASRTQAVSQALLSGIVKI